MFVGLFFKHIATWGTKTFDRSKNEDMECVISYINSTSLK